MRLKSPARLQGRPVDRNFLFLPVSASEFKLTAWHCKIKCRRIKTYSAKVSPLVCTPSYPQGSLQALIQHHYKSKDIWPFPLFSLEFYCISKVNFKQTFRFKLFLFFVFFKCKLLTSTKWLHAIERGGSPSG